MALDPSENTTKAMSVIAGLIGPEGKGIPLEQYIQCALYHPEIGYYMHHGERVGRSPQTDFYTSSSIKGLFPRLVLEAVRSLLDEPLSDYVFVEAGPESAGGILGNYPDHPFKDIRLIRPGDPFDIPDQAIVFSNELFDAQPFRRFVWHESKWREAGVAIHDGSLENTLLDPENLPELPADAPEGYTIDWPQRANSLLGEIAGKSWRGLFIAFDYGLDRRTLFTERPEGTGRTYSRHTMGSNLLERPGEIDITCHVVWDVMESILREHGFENVELSRQESFFMRHSQSAIGDILEASPIGFSPQKQSLMELLNPGNMGHLFQVLSARRNEFQKKLAIPS
jgi:SAM-dependent MidA family methyltransferase